MRKVLILAAGAALVFGSFGGAAFAAGKDKVWVCHRTGSAGNPYVGIRVGSPASPFSGTAHAIPVPHHTQVGNGLGPDLSNFIMAKGPLKNLGIAPADQSGSAVGCLDP